MTYFQLFLAFFFPNILAYGGGPSAIPLIEHEVVDKYGWMTKTEFSEFLALANSLPGPIATKMAGYIGFEVAGIAGSAIALFATIGPSLALMLILLNLLYKYRNSPRVKRLSNFVLPAIAVLLLTLTFDFLQTSYELISIVPTILLVIASYLALEKRNIHPAFVIAAGLLIGGFFL
ncbi:MAG: chromate transporter [Solibacillus sp.]|jgi:chromate transporter|uniref:chromate transporter n=1 Tax=unclassified Solibacillus TaxID=2637870 RepID=UPI0030F83323